MKFSINKSYMKLIEYYLNIFHYVIYVYCIKYKRFLPDYSPSLNSGIIMMWLSLILVMQLLIIHSLIYKIFHISYSSDYDFYSTIFFELLVWFSVIHKEKYRLYFKEFKQLPPEIIKKWQKNTHLALLITLMFLVVSMLLLNVLWNKIQFKWYCPMKVCKPLFSYLCIWKHLKEREFDISSMQLAGSQWYGINDSSLWLGCFRCIFLRKIWNGRIKYRFLEQMIDFYFMIHYVVYRFYRKRSTEDRDICLLYACCLNLSFFIGLILGVAHFLCKLLEIQNIINKSFVYFYVIISLIFEYLVFFRKDRYLKIFAEYEKRIDTPAMKRKMKNAKIFNYSIFIVDIIMLFISDYLNHHGG